MTSEEAAAFEEKLAKDENLRREYQNIREVGHAVTKVHSIEAIRASIKADEGKVTEPSPSLESDLLNLEKELVVLDAMEDKQKKSSKVIQMSFTRIAASLAVAASLALAVIIPVNHNHLKNAGYNESLRILQSEGFMRPMESFRGNDPFTIDLGEVQKVIQEGRHEDALTIIDEELRALNAWMPELEKEGSVYSVAELEKVRQELEWYKAVLLLNQKETRSAKKLLKAISRSGSVYSEEATRILKDIL